MVELCNTVPPFLYNTSSCLPKEYVTYLTFIETTFFLTAYV